MSWKDQLNSPLTIKTGDGEIYKPLTTISANKGSFDFNISEFHFPEVAGTKVDRRLHKGTRYPLEFYFQGEDNIDQFKAFVQSSKDTRPWEVLHPVYGQFVAHPLSIEFDNSGANTTKINCTVVETILEGGPRVLSDLKGTANAAIEKAKQTNSDYAKTVEPTIQDVVTLKTTTNQMYDISISSVKDSIEASKYFNLYTKATNAINTSLNEFNTAVDFLQAFIYYPAQFRIGIKERFKSFKEQALKLSAILDNLNDKSSKQLFESQKGAIISTAIEASLLPVENDYTNAVDVVVIIDDLISMYNTFINELQGLQSANGTELESYLPNSDFMFNLNYSVNYAVSNLFAIAVTAQQERVVYLEHDSNVIVQAHRFYGLLPNDSTIKKFIDTNNISMKEMIQIEKGRKLVYYV